MHTKQFQNKIKIFTQFNVVFDNKIMLASRMSQIIWPFLLQFMYIFNKVD